MKYLKIIFILALVGIFNPSCTKELDLDDETLLKVDKQGKLEKLNQLFDLAFEDPQKAEIDFESFLQTELITETQNFLSDLDVNNQYTLTKLAIQLNVDHAKKMRSIDQTSLFNIYQNMYEVDLSNRTLWGSIPEQLKQGEQLKKFEAKMEEIKTSYKQVIAEFKEKSQVDVAITEINWWGGIFAYKPDFSKFYSGSFSFKLNKDNSLNYESFFFIPAIPKIGALAGAQEEKDFDPKLLLSPLEYEVYGDRIFFHFHIKNNYDYESQSGKLERVWNYEYKYEIKDGTLVLSEPRILNYMFPVLISISHDDPVFKTNYLDPFSGFEKDIVLSPM